MVVSGFRACAPVLPMEVTQMEDPHFIPPSAIDQRAVLSVWSAVLPPRCKVLGASLFGDLFVARESGEIDMLDLVAGELRQVAVCVEEFEWDLTQPRRREEVLMQSLAEAAASAGLTPDPGECLAFRTPPLLGGPLRPENLVRWNMVAYHAGLSKLLPQIEELPAGTEVVRRPDAGTAE
jgi:hypothetical protein